MEFIGVNKKLIVYKDTVVLDDVIYNVSKLQVYSKDVLRMTFGDYEIKMYKGDLRLVNNATNFVISMVQSNKDEIDVDDDIWYDYNVYHALVASINKSHKVIKLNDVPYPVTKIVQQGNRTSYFCSEGEMRIKKDGRGDWNKIEMSLKI